jgi:hypothetical protein
VNTIQTMLLSILILFGTPLAAETCQQKIDSTGAYTFSHSVPIGNGMVECYVKAKDGTGSPSLATIAYTDESSNTADDADCELDRLAGKDLTDAITNLMERYTLEANQQLINDPKQATEESGHSGLGFFNAVYGSIVERLTAKRVTADTCLSKYLRPLSSTEQSRKGEDNMQGSHPDFEGLGKANGLQYDVTTAPQAERKQSQNGAKQNYIFLIYERGLELDPKTRTAVKISR